ncbi:MAG: bifunctional 4-hydroxy-2-oxoglutarate aldolase/2-dehydro-3-deoxy-phosphogluconate aldolase [Synechococcaceae cyanobacterium]|nr:bifunctional 4-hydroxy-2-oxoglutarate aldolase/2-dehydro-3-deoxy-phosphogluconate aldolase [Synechococcaceae cyanobacterium]
MASLRRQPLLVVLRPQEPQLAAPALERLVGLGVRHVEIAWQPGVDDWSSQCRRLAQQFPGLALGAASICCEPSLEAAIAAGFGYAVSPVLERRLQRRAEAAGLTLVPGVMTPSEVQRARRWGCHIVKLFPAVSVGPQHWRRLRQPLGGMPLPLVIAAGGLTPADVPLWLEAGVDAVALGSGLAVGDDAELRRLLAWLQGRS